MPTQVTGTFTDLLTGQPMSFTACSGVPVTPGVNRVAEPARDAFDVQDVVLTRTDGPLAGSGAPRVSAAAAPAAVRSWTSARRVLQVSAPTRSYLVVNENFNPGWQARLGSRALRAVRIDGWKQAWLLPAGTAGAVTLTFAPNALYRDAILGGLATLALVALVALWPPAPAWRRIPGFRRAARWFRVPGSRRTAEQAGTRAREPGGPAAPELSPGDQGVRNNPGSLPGLDCKRAWTRARARPRTGRCAGPRGRASPRR